MSQRLAVLGAGNGGQALAGHLALKGLDVALFEQPAFGGNIRKMLEHQRIRLTGEVEGEAALVVTTDAERALEGARVIFIVVPAFAQGMMWKMARRARSVEIVIFVPDNYASLKFAFPANGADRKALVAGTSTLPYACRARDGVVKISGMKKQVYVSSHPSSANQRLRRQIGSLHIDSLVVVKDTFEVNLSNLNMIIHCPTALLNVGRIERAERFRFYTEAITPSIGGVIKALDRERVAVEKRLGVRPKTAEELFKMYYGIERGDLFKTITTARVYSGLGYDGPRTLKHRYFTEDIPYGLVPLSLIGRSLGVSTPICDSIITLASTLNRTDYRSIGAVRMGRLSGLDH